MKKRVLGLDISTTTIGVGVLDYDDRKIELVHYEYFKPPKKVHELEKMFATRNYIIDLLNTYKPDDIAIEEYIKFMKGQSGAKTIIPLALLNRTVGLTAYIQMNKMPFIYNVLKIRHKLKFSKELPAKEEMPEVVAKHLGLKKFPYYTKTVKKTGEEKIMTESFDVADGISVALAHIKISK